MARPLRFGRLVEFRRARLLLVFGVYACGSDDVVAPPVAPAHHPVVFVHGFGRSAADFAPVLTRFRADGWTDRELHAASYASIASNAVVAEQIRDDVDSILAATGAAKVDIVAFSMGSLSSRYYIRNLGGGAKVDAWVSIAGPNHGTQTAEQCNFTPCVEMRPGSAFLNALNSGDETPGDVRYATWWSPCDQTIVPNSSVVLTGATNTQTDCLPHSGMFTETVYRQVRDFIHP